MAESTQTYAEKVKEFTEEGLGQPVPERPRAATLEEMKFITEMNVSELIEALVATYAANGHQDPWSAARLTIVESVFKDRMRKVGRNGGSPLPVPDIQNDTDLLLHQIDAPLDMHYYNLNHLAKLGVNATPFANIIHDANMDKKDPEQGWLRSPDGKILKRHGWSDPEPLLRYELERQQESGAWN